MDATTLLGIAAGSATTLAFIPQVIKTWRTRSTHDISLGMFLLFSTGLVLWLIYGVLIGSWPIIIANSVTLVLALMIVVLKLRYG
ncbi:MAG: SemiSWEET transporter [Pseudomonadota bacterium]